MRRSLFACWICWSVLFQQPGFVSAQELKPNSALVAAIDEAVKQQGITADGPGVAVMVIQPGRLLFMKGYGLANLRDNAPITSQTMFELASVSKPFTATAVLILHDRGKLSVHDDVCKHIPELPEYRTGHPIRVSDLLQHVSGLPDYMDFEKVPARHKDYWVNEDYVPMFAKRQTTFPLDFPTGEKYEYNNTNYMLLAVVVERVSKKSFGTFLHDEVFVPAGMKHSFVYENPAAIPKPSTKGYTHALGYEKGKKKGWRETWGTRPAREETMLTVGDGAVWTNLDDMVHWDAALRGGKLLKPETMRLALTPSKTRDGETNDYGFGWSVYLDKSGRMNGYGHEGSWGGFQTSYYRYLLADRTTVLLSNRGSFDTDKFWYALNDVIEKHLPKK